jgi:hypothetical protein
MPPPGYIENLGAAPPRKLTPGISYRQCHLVVLRRQLTLGHSGRHADISDAIEAAVAAIMLLAKERPH